MPFAIFKGRAFYIRVSWPTRAEADAALVDLLKPYPADSEWRQRIVVRESNRIFRCMHTQVRHRAPTQVGSKVRLITVGGRTQNMTGWAREIGITTRTLGKRLERGWTIDDAVRKPHRSELGRRAA